MKTILSSFKAFRFLLSSLAVLVLMASVEKSVAQNKDVLLNPNWSQYTPVLSTLV